MKAVSNYFRASLFTIEETFQYLDAAERGVAWFPGPDGYPLPANSTSLRYQVFRQSHVCVRCGLPGAYFALEKSIHEENARKWHLNLYGIGPDGREILFTKDHIIPVSKGGPDTLKNLQTMCEICNGEKGSSIV
jgi:hypothetical protein